MNWQRIRNIVRPGQKCCTGQPGNPFGKGADGKVPALDIIERAFFFVWSANRLLQQNPLCGKKSPGEAIEAGPRDGEAGSSERRKPREHHLCGGR